MIEISSEQYYQALNEILKYIPKQDAQDVLHNILLQDTLTEFNLAYICKACYKAYRVKNRKEIPTEDFKDLESSDEDVYQEPIDIIPFIDNCESISWWEKELVKRRNLENKKFREMAKECNLNLNQTSYSYYKAIRKIRNEFESERNKMNRI